MGIFSNKGDGGKKPPKPPKVGKPPPGNPRPTTQKPKRGNKPGS